MFLALPSLSVTLPHELYIGFLDERQVVWWIWNSTKNVVLLHLHRDKLTTHAKGVLMLLDAAHEF